MSTIKIIMVPLAFSKYSKEIFSYSVRLATAMNSELLIVNVINQRDVETVQRITSYGYDVDQDHYVQEIQTQRIQELEAMLENIDFPEEKIRLIFKVGKPANILLSLSISENIDMIVMGIKGQSDLIHGFTGSVAEKLFRRSPVTIVSYRADKNAKKLAKYISTP